jgi:type I restriction-modification system DNA methylase subunit
MPTTFDKAFAKVQELIATFEANKERYLSTAYQEAEVRKDFIDKFWIALGWDVNHDKQKNPYEQEVKVERGVYDGAARTRADYAFFLSPNFHDVRFYVEAKKPSGDFASRDNYFQTLCYGWGSKNTARFAVLTSFEDFHILDCYKKPNINDTLSRVVERFTYTDYSDSEKFSRIYWLFSREAVANGSLEKEAARRPKIKSKTFRRGLFKGGDTNPDDEFLEELDGYRQKLAHAFKSSNPDLDGELLTEVTQRTLDRLVFTRFLEDKMIEPPQVENFGKQDGVWEDFIHSSLRLDRKYNGVVYKQHPKLDAPGFQPDGKVFARICEELSDPTSPYNFNTIPVYILGSIYERFLGKVISDNAQVVEKPAVRKAHGVYYTPEYIVRYIVENTVGKLIEGKVPAQIAEMKFADIACGSGSFLLGVYDLLLRYHSRYYSANPGRMKKGDCVKRDGTFHLSIQKKREILTNNIYGVDIDRQAVEVAQLSLYLKLLEDETIGSTSEFQTEFHYTLLPSLDKNIVCGNSLVGPDILDGGKLSVEEEKKINPLDYAQRFPQIFRRKVSGGELRESAPGELEHNMPGGMPLHGGFSYKKKTKAVPGTEYEGGFDAIVGNPPYVRIQGFPRRQLDYFSNHYQSACGNFDLYVNFIERGYKLLKTGGLLGQIVPNKFFKTDYGEGLRKLIVANTALQKIVDFGASQVFDATTYTCLLFLAKKAHPKFCYALSEANEKSLPDSHFSEHSIETLTPKPWVFGNKSTNSILAKITQAAVRLLDLPAEISRGSSTGDDEVFMVETVGCNLEPAVLRIPLFASDFSRYSFSPTDKWRVVFPYKVKNGKSELMAEKEFQKLYPKAFEVLQSRKSALLKRKQFSKWFSYSAPRNLPVHERAQICIPLLADRGLFALIPPNTRGKLCPMASGGFTIGLAGSVKMKPEYILGLLNSSLLFWRLRQISNVFRGGWITCTKQYFGELPIRVIDFSNSSDKSRHDKLVTLVDQMLAAKKQLPQAQSERDKEFYENKCAALDNQIDALVYELYGLTADEIKLVESAQK